MIKKKYLVAFVLLFFVVAISSYMSYKMNYELYIEEVTINLQDMSNTASYQYDSVFNEIDNEVNNTIETIEKETMNPENLAALLKKTSDSSFYIHDMAVMTEEGNYIGEPTTKNHLTFDNIMLYFADDAIDSKLLKSISEEANVYYTIKRLQLVNGSALLLVGIDYDIINKIVHPDEYKMFDASLYLLSNNGYFLYHKDKQLIGKNLMDDEEYIKDYIDITASDYNKLVRAITDTQHVKDQYYMEYDAYGTSKIAYYKYLQSLQGVAFLSIDFNSIARNQMDDTLRLIIPLVLSLTIAACILLRYIYLIKFTDYFTEVKNEYAYRKHIKKMIRTNQAPESYLIIEIEDVSNDKYGKFLYDDHIFYHISNHFKQLAPLYRDLYRISRLHYMFVLKGNKDKSYLRKLIHKINDGIEVKGKQPLYIRGRKYFFTLDKIDELVDYEVDSKVLNHMSNNSSDLTNVHGLTFVKYSEILKVLDQRLKEKFYIENVLLEDRLNVKYEPIMDIVTNEIHSYEVIMHMEDGDTTVSLAELMHVAEQENMIGEIERKIIQQVFYQFHLMVQKTHKIMQLNINLSSQYLSDDMVQFIDKMAERYRIEPAYITFELTKIADVSNLDVAIESLNALRKLGFKLALDDFGKGCYNIELLSKLELDYIKIDGSFIKDVEKDEQKLKTLNALTYIANNYKAKIIANFVDNEKVIIILKRLGIAYGQGDYFGSQRDMIKGVTYF